MQTEKIEEYPSESKQFKNDMNADGWSRFQNLKHVEDNVADSDTQSLFADLVDEFLQQKLNITNKILTDVSSNKSKSKVLGDGIKCSEEINKKKRIFNKKLNINFKNMNCRAEFDKHFENLKKLKCIKNCPAFANYTSNNESVCEIAYKEFCEFLMKKDQEYQNGPNVEEIVTEDIPENEEKVCTPEPTLENVPEQQIVRERKITFWRFLDGLCYVICLPIEFVKIITSNEDIMAMLRVIADIGIELLIAVVMAGVTMVMSAFLILEESRKKSNLNERERWNRINSRLQLIESSLKKAEEFGAESDNRN